MKTFSIRTLLILVLVCGFACWFFFVPVRVEVKIWVHIAPRAEPGDNVRLIATKAALGNPDTPEVISSAKLISIPSKSIAVVAMSRLDYLRSNSSASWLMHRELEAIDQ